MIIIMVIDVIFMKIIHENINKQSRGLGNTMSIFYTSSKMIGNETRYDGHHSQTFLMSWNIKNFKII